MNRRSEQLFGGGLAVAELLSNAGTLVEQAIDFGDDAYLLSERY